MQLNKKLLNTIKSVALCALLVVATLSTTACGMLDGVFDFLEGGEQSAPPVDYSSDTSADTDDTSTELPDTDGALFTTTSYGDGLMITGYTGTSPVVKIPSAINGLPVVAVGEGIKDTTAEDGTAVAITTLIVPDSVSQISFSAFSGCKALQALTVPFVGGKADDHAYIGYVFGVRNTSGNASALPESLTAVTAGGVSVADNAFKGCESLQSITLEGVTSVGKNAFQDCTALKKLVIPNTVTAIGENAFNGCDNLFDISLPFLGNGSDKLFFGAVFGASDYRHNFNYVPSTLRYVTINCPADIPEGAFYECNGIVTLTINNAVDTVATNAFYRCKRLKTLTVNGGEGYAGIKQLAPYAFGYCAALGEVRLSGDISTLPTGAFYGCTALRSVYFGETANVMPATVTTVEKGAFAYCANITSMELSPALTVIEEQSFYGCSYLLSLTIPNAVTEVKKDAFKGCSALKTLALGNGLTTVGNGAFSYCGSLGKVTLPKGISFVGDNAFAYSTALADVVLENKDVQLGNDVFAGCEKIVVTVDFSGTAYNALLEAGLGNTNLKSPA